jgi:hypothetical protein
MGHPKVKNNTAFALETLFVADENGVPLCVPVVKATFVISADASVSLAEEQAPVAQDGICRGDPATSSYIYEPETAFIKLATDVVLVGHAYAGSRRATEVLTGIRVGSIQKLVKVIGDRVLARRSGVVAVSTPQPFDRIPLTYERAFGGWDRRHPDPDRHRVEARNPVGTGFRDPTFETDDEVRLPNLEDPEHPFRAYGECQAPAGFGFVSPNWAPRSQFAGTYDERWADARSPLLPEDFDRRFFNAASPGLITSGYLRGDERVIVLNASPEGRLDFELPRIAPPACQYELRNGKKASAATQLDTVIVNTDDRLLILIWRAHFSLRTGPHDLVVLRVGSEAGISTAA